MKADRAQELAWILDEKEDPEIRDRVQSTVFFLATSGGASASEISFRIGAPPEAVQESLDLLEKFEMVEGQASSSTAPYSERLYHLTGAGRRFYRGMTTRKS